VRIPRGSGRAPARAAGPRAAPPSPFSVYRIANSGSVQCQDCTSTGAHARLPLDEQQLPSAHCRGALCIAQDRSGTSAMMHNRLSQPRHKSHRTQGLGPADAVPGVRRSYGGRAPTPHAMASSPSSLAFSTAACLWPRHVPGTRAIADAACRPRLPTGIGPPCPPAIERRTGRPGDVRSERQRPHARPAPWRHRATTGARIPRLCISGPARAPAPHSRHTSGRCPPACGDTRGPARAGGGRSDPLPLRHPPRSARPHRPPFSPAPTPGRNTGVPPSHSTGAGSTWTPIRSTTGPY
jgi:hypothetical protein